MLLTLINDLMDLAKLETLNFKFNEEFFDLNELIQQAFRTIKSQSDQKGIHLICDLRSNLNDKNKSLCLQDANYEQGMI